MTYRNNAIEGSSISFDETCDLLFDYGHAFINTIRAEELHEAENHKKVLGYLIYLSNYSGKSLSYVCQTFDKFDVKNA